MEANLKKDITDWFVNSDLLCNWTNFSLIQFDKENKKYIPKKTNLIKLDLEKRDIIVQTGTALRQTFFLNVTTQGGVYQVKEI